jgi:hypothetical protein
LGHINRIWENTGKAIKISTKYSLGKYKAQQQKPQLEKMLKIIRQKEKG